MRNFTGESSGTQLMNFAGRPTSVGLLVCFIEGRGAMPRSVFMEEIMAVEMSEREYALTLLGKIRQARELLDDLADSKMVEVANRELGIGEPALDLEDLVTELSALAGQFKELYLPE